MEFCRVYYFFVLSVGELASFSSSFVYFISISLLRESFMDIWMGSQHLPHLCANFKWVLYNSLLSFSFFIYKNFTSYFILILVILFLVNMAAGDVIGILIFIQFRVRFCLRHCQMK